MKSIRPWPAGTECSVEGYAEFKNALMKASFHNAADGSGEMNLARAAVIKAAETAIEQEWPYWVMAQMFQEIAPLQAWDSFMQHYINLLTSRIK